jgi:hypothetical protein
MRHLNLFLCLSLYFFNCHGQTKNDLGIPDVVNIDKGKATQKFPGTNVFINCPPDCLVQNQIIRFQHAGDTYIQLLRFPGPQISNFEAEKRGLERQIASAVSDGSMGKEYYKKEFILGGYKALLIYCPDERPREEILLLFGDTHSTSMALGAFPPAMPAIRQEVLNGLLSLYVDRSNAADPTAGMTFTVDLSHTQFKYIGAASPYFYYTVDGKGDPAQAPFLDRIGIMGLPALKDKEELKAFAINIIEEYKNKGMDIPGYSGKEVMINGNYAYEISFECSLKGRKCSMYQVLTGDTKGSVLLLGGLYDRVDELMPQIKAIAQTLKIK